MRHLLLLALLAPTTSLAATTGSVTVLLKNAGEGRFSSLDRVTVTADVDTGTDRTANVPGSGAAGPSVAFNANYFGLTVFDGAVGTYRFYVTFPDNDGTKTVELASGVQFPTGSSFVSALGVTATNPGAAYAFEIANDAPVALSITGCEPDAGNPTQNIAIDWDLATVPGDFDRYLLQRADADGLTWTTVATYTAWGATDFTDTSRTPSTEYRYRLVHQDRYDAITNGPEIVCATSNGDLDEDGFVGPAYGGDDCNDDNATIFPGATEIAGDGIDQDCDGADLEGTVDSDRDAWPDYADNCPDVSNIGQQDLDGDGAGDACDPDNDNDGVADDVDVCPNDYDADQADLDLDFEGDGCDDDDDGDGISDDGDVCPRVADAEQYDLDHDLIGDACDGDDDGDGVADEIDVCPADFDPDQADTDGDGTGDACDPFTDFDADLVVDADDNCPFDANPEQLDTDADGAGDACDVDDDNDGVEDDLDLCPVNTDALQEDADADGLGNACDEDDDEDGVVDADDNCVFDANAGQGDADTDGVGDACDADADGDEVDDAFDNCLGRANADQFDNDEDGFGDACDDDDDDDGILDEAPDNCVFLANPGQEDLDLDGEGDVCDADDDGDAVLDLDDNCPVDWNEDQLDTDMDGEGDACDLDDDDDGIGDPDDLCATVSDPDQADMDCDGLGDACDDDVDGDDYLNEVDACIDQATYGVELNGDGCPDTSCDVADWIAGRSTAEISNRVSGSLQRSADRACDEDDGRYEMLHLGSLWIQTFAHRGRRIAPDTADTLLESIAWIETDWLCTTYDLDCDMLDTCWDG